MRVVVGSDHAGYELKEYVKHILEEKGYEIIDVGTNSGDSADYSDFAFKAAQLVSKGVADRGVLVCGTGTTSSASASAPPTRRSAS